MGKDQNIETWSQDSQLNRVPRHFPDHDQNVRVNGADSEQMTSAANQRISLLQSTAIYYRAPTQMSSIISRTLQDIFELISMTFSPKNVEKMEQQSSFQIPINLSFLKFNNFQDFPGHFARFHDIPGHSRRWEPCINQVSRTWKKIIIIWYQILTTIRLIAPIPIPIRTYPLEDIPI